MLYNCICLCFNRIIKLFVFFVILVCFIFITTTSSLKCQLLVIIWTTWLSHG